MQSLLLGPGYHGQHDVRSLLLSRHLRAHIFACSLGDLRHDRVLSYPSTAETTGTDYDYGVGGRVFVLVHNWEGGGGLIL